MTQGAVRDTVPVIPLTHPRFNLAHLDCLPPRSSLPMQRDMTQVGSPSVRSQLTLVRGLQVPSLPPLCLPCTHSDWSTIPLRSSVPALQVALARAVSARSLEAAQLSLRQKNMDPVDLIRQLDIDIDFSRVPLPGAALVRGVVGWSVDGPSGSGRSHLPTGRRLQPVAGGRLVLVEVWMV